MLSLICKGAPESFARARTSHRTYCGNPNVDSSLIGGSLLVRQLQEKCQGKDLYQCFIDLAKAFNSVKQKLVSKLACPKIFVDLIRTTPDDMKAWIGSC